MTVQRTPGPLVLLATCGRWPHGEPGAAALDRALTDRGLESRWARWDDPSVDWTAADVVAVRSTWDYSERVESFLEWAGSVGPRLLHGADVFAWNTRKDYLIALDAAGVPVVPTRIAATTEAVLDIVSADRRWVVKPAVGAGGRGVVLVEGGRWSAAGNGPWIVQPYLPSVAEAGELSVFIIDGRPVAQVAKRPAAGEIRVHEVYGGAAAPVALTEDATSPALTAYAVAQQLLDVDLAYARVDLLARDGRWVVSEVELTEPGLYLDVLPGNADAFADALAHRLR